MTIDGIYGQGTRAAVLAAQRWFGLPETGTVGAQTWDAIYNQYSGIENTTLRNAEVFPNQASGSSIPRSAGSNNSRTNYARSTTQTQFPGRDLSIGTQDVVRQEVVR